MIKHFLKKALLLQLFLLFTAVLFAQQKSVSGKVTDADGKGLPGVTVSVKGTTTAVATNGDGFYTITVPNNQAVLRFSGVGYLNSYVMVCARYTLKN